MGEYFVKRPLKRPPVHPGEILREDVLPTLGLSVSEAARRLGLHQLDPVPNRIHSDAQSWGVFLYQNTPLPPSKGE
jgi:hypothetical protein